MTTIIAAFIAVFAVAIVLICLWSVLSPQWLFSLAGTVLEQRWLMPVAVGMRLLLGLALLWLAEASALPLLFYIIGCLSIVAALLLPFIGLPRIRQLVGWIETLPRRVLRLWMGFGVALGAALLYGVHTLLW